MMNYSDWESLIPSVFCLTDSDVCTHFIKTVSGGLQLRAMFAQNIDDFFNKKNGEFDAVLLDDAFCIKDQYAALKKLRNSHSYDSLPVLVLACRSSSQSIPAYLFEIGVQDIIIIPEDAAAFIARVKAHVRMKRLFDYSMLQKERAQKEYDKIKIIDRVSIEHASLMENNLFEKIEFLTREDEERQKELENLIKENERFKNEINDLELLCSTLVTHDTVLENDLSLRLENANELATTDYLTNIYNRTKFYEFLRHEVFKVSIDSFYDLSLVMFDVDYFKNINDTYGHDVGDIVLKEITHAVKSVIRENDIFCRWGGEEFMVLLPSCRLEEAEMKAEEMRRIIESIKYEYVSKVTCSFGVVHYRSGEHEESFLKRSDLMMYKAKKAGRNRVISVK